MKIGVGLSYYNDFDSLFRMLLSLQSYPFDVIIAVDGRYQEYPSTKDASDTSCSDLFRTFRTPYKYYLLGGIGARQITKRNKYFDVSDGLDFLLVIDSDEYIVHDKTNWYLFTQELEQKVKTNYMSHPERQGYCIPFQGFNIQGDSNKKSMNNSLVRYIPRLFYKPNTLEYHINHYTIRNKDTKLIQVYNGNNYRCEHIMIGHDHSLRDSERLKQQGEYAKLRPH